MISSEAMPMKYKIAGKNKKEKQIKHTRIQMSKNKKKIESKTAIF